MANRVAVRSAGGGADSSRRVAQVKVPARPERKGFPTGGWVERGRTGAEPATGPAGYCRAAIEASGAPKPGRL